MLLAMHNVDRYFQMVSYPLEPLAFVGSLPPKSIAFEDHWLNPKQIKDYDIYCRKYPIQLTYSLLISPYNPLIKSSILLQLRHFFFYSSGVYGR